MSIQPKTKSFGDLAKESNQRKKERRKREKKKRNQRKPRKKGKEKREREGEGPRQQGRRRERSHGSKEKEDKIPASHHGQPRTTVAVAVICNAVSRQNCPFSLLLNITSKIFFLNDFKFFL